MRRICWNASIIYLKAETTILTHFVVKIVGATGVQNRWPSILGSCQETEVTKQTLFQKKKEKKKKGCAMTRFFDTTVNIYHLGFLLKHGATKVQGLEVIIQVSFQSLCNTIHHNLSVHLNKL
jgi:hypothetical protein